jgi:murein DD-endopeptidase MepM/ murein hydrolase activator NlpD
MKFYTYQKDSVSYRRFKFLRPKFLIYFLLIQICIAVGLLFSISTFYDTPKEKKLKEDISYLLHEFDEVNQRIIESETVLQQIKEHDSIIYKSIFDVEDITKKDFEVYYDDLTMNDYSDIVQKTNQRLSILDKELAKELYSLDKLVIKAYNHQEMLTHIPAIQPIDNKDLKRTASGWGYRIHPIYKIRKFHYGLDFTAKTGTPIYATGDGTIQHTISHTSRASQGYGNLIIIDHGYGYRTLYAHMSKFNVSVGQEVKRGEVIGFVGNTGLSTGPHLHYEVIKNGRKVNPVHYLFHDLTPEEYQRIVEISSKIKKSYD